MFEMLKVGEKFIRPGYVERIKNYDGGLMGTSSSGFEMLVCLNDMTNDEAELLKSGDIEFRIIENTDKDCILNIVRFGSNKLTLEFPYDPTKMLDVIPLEEKKENVLTSNALHIVGVDSRSIIVKSLRLVTMPDKLLRKCRPAWEKSFTINNYSEKYNDFLDNCYRYDIKKLWNIAEFVDKIRR